MVKAILRDVQIVGGGGEINGGAQRAFESTAVDRDMLLADGRARVRGQRRGRGSACKANAILTDFVTKPRACLKIASHYPEI